METSVLILGLICRPNKKIYILNFNFQREHNETLAKLNFVLALVDCILELARSRAAPITALRQNAAMRDSVSGKGSRL